MLGKYVSGLDHVALQLSDIEAGMRFFHELLGFKVNFEVRFEDYHIVMLKAGKVEIEMWENQSEGGLLTEVGVHHIAIAVKGLDTVIDIVKESGYKVVADIYTPTRGIREAIVIGPDAIRIQFVEKNIPVLLWRLITGDLKT